MNNCYYPNNPCNQQGSTQNYETKIIGPRGPRGCPGQAAIITIGTVTTGETASVTNTGTSTNAVLNFVLPVNSTTDAYATLYSNTAQTIDASTGYTNVVLSSATLNNITFDTTTSNATINEAGTYLITYDITPTTGAGNGNVAILKNSTPITGSIKAVVLDNSNISSTVVLTLNASDTISLGVIANTDTIELTTTPITNATLSITKIN